MVRAVCEGVRVRGCPTMAHASKQKASKSNNKPRKQEEEVGQGSHNLPWEKQPKPKKGGKKKKEKKSGRNWEKGAKAEKKSVVGQPKFLVVVVLW